MPAVNIATNETEHIGLLERFRELPRVVPKILAMGLNETAKKTKVRISRGIRAKVNIKKRDIDPYIDIQRAKADKLEARVVLSESDRLPLHYFNPRQIKGPGGGVAYKINKANPGFLPGGFLVPKASLKHAVDGVAGSVVFKRKGTARLPIEKKAGPSPWGVFVVAKMQNETVIDAEAELSKQVDRAANFFELQLTGEIGPRTIDIDDGFAYADAKSIEAGGDQ